MTGQAVPLVAVRTVAVVAQIQESVPRQAPLTLVAVVAVLHSTHREAFFLGRQAVLVL